MSLRNAARDWAVERILAELDRAEAKFPAWPSDVIHAAAIVGEEAGEMMRAAVQATYEGGDLSAVETEAVQTAATAIRFVMYPKCVRPSEQTVL